MVQWIAILVILVSLSGSSFSRSWGGFDDYDYFESAPADTDSSESNRKARHYGDHGPWDSDEDDGSSEHHGYGYEYDRPDSNDEQTHYGRDNGYSSHVDHGYHHHGHNPDHYHENHGYNHHGYKHHEYNHHGYNHHGYHNNKDEHGQPGSSNWNSHVYNQGHRNLETHVETPGQPNHKGYGDQNKKPDAGRNWGSTQNYLKPTLYTKIPSNQGSSHGSHGQPGQNYGSQGPNQAGSSGWQNSRGVQNSWNVGIVGPNDADRVVFPGSNNQIPTNRGPAVTTTRTNPRPNTTSTRTTSTTRTPTTARPSTTSTTSRTTVINTTLLNMVLCVRACPTTPEYNPVCGSNNITYNNPGALRCAANCGINVSLARSAPCPPFSPSSTTTSTSTTTNRPSTTTERPKSTLPLDVILSIFGQPTNSNTEEPEFDIDKRRKTKH